MLAKLIPRCAMLTAGTVIGISFVAQPLKFRAGDVPLAHLVRAGSAIFHGSHALQLVVLSALVLLALLPRAQARGALGLLSTALVRRIAIDNGFMRASCCRSADSVKEPRPGKNQKANIWVYFRTMPRPAVCVVSVNCDSL